MINLLSFASNSAGSDNGLPRFCPIAIGAITESLIVNWLFSVPESSLRYFATHPRTVLSDNFGNYFTYFAVARAGPCMLAYLAIISLSLSL